MSGIKWISFTCMRVVVNYVPGGRLGNRMFQYAFGYILSKIYSCELVCNEALPNFNIESTPYTSLNSNIIRTRDYGDQSFDINNIKRFDGDIVVDSFLQKSIYYLNYREELREVFGVVKQQPINEDALVLHIRETDYTTLGVFLGYNYYKKLIDSYGFSHVKIVTDNPYSECVSQLVRDGCQLLTSSAVTEFMTHGDESVMKDFKTLLYSDNIGISQSSFAWWAAFLGYHKKIIFPFKNDIHWWKITPNHDDVDLYFNIPGITDKFII